MGKLNKDIEWPLEPRADDCRALWSAVLFQAIKDATESNIETIKAYYWVMRENRDFNEVCDLAGFDPTFIREKVTAFIDKKHSFLRVRRDR